LAWLLTTLALPATLRELFGPTAVAWVLDSAAVPPAVRYRTALAGVLVRGLPAALFLVLLAILASPSPTLAAVGMWTLRALAALVTLGVLQIPLALLLVRRGWLSSPHLLAALGLISAILYVPGLHILIAPWAAPAAHLRMLLLDALDAPAPAGDGWLVAPWTATVPILVLSIAIFWSLGGWAFTRWHREELTASRRTPQRRYGGARSKTSTSPLGALVRRDLHLLRRRFSPAVAIAMGSAIAIDLAVLLLLLDGRLPLLWLRRLAVLGGTLAVLAACALLPFLVRHQLARLWIERSSGVDTELLWRAKLRTAGWLAAPVFGMGAMVLTRLPGHDAMAIAGAVLQLAAASLVVASMVGLAVFELAEQPVLGLVFSAFVALAVASLFVFYPKAWWLWLILYMYLAGQIAGRAGRQVRLLEIP